MGWIALEDIRFHAYHGFYEEEQKAGNEFVLDTYINVDFEKEASSDKLEETVNYETVYLICQKVMRQKRKLLEKVLDELIRELTFQFDGILQLRVRLRKIRPLPGERVGSAFVEIEKDFRKKCPKCSSTFSCYNSPNCWCSALEIGSSALQNLRTQYQGCLCPNCLKIHTLG
ncbi:MAG: dihydroneopterin aldolase [Saprospiraceae bacterium]|nr:dihydroneopterin aldolase [Saprospiraceae bacterium]